jgi:glycosyltransferase involved in cell wall biosynthesis
MKKFLVLVPAYNESKNIEKFLKMFYNQHYPQDKFRVVVAVNNTSDDTIKVAKKYLEHTSRGFIVDIIDLGKQKKHITQGITKWSGNLYDTETKKSLRVLPSSEMMAFYITKIQKV